MKSFTERALAIRKSNRSTSRFRADLLISALMLIVTSLLAYYAAGQWKVMNQQAQLMNRTLREIGLQTSAAQQSALAAARSADVAAESLELAKNSGKAGELKAEQALTQSSKQMKIMRDQAHSEMIAANVARDMYEGSERPWIRVKSPILTEPLRISPLGAVVEFQVTLENIGHSPASSVAVWFTATQPSFVDPTGKSAQLALCKSMRERPDAYIPTTLFPGDTVDRGVQAVILHENAADSIRPGTLNTFLIGCVTYRYAISTEIHQTGFGYYLTGKNPKDGKEMHSLKLDREIPVADLFLETHSDFLAFAN